MLAIASQCVVLIVEDHADTAQMLARHLARRGIPAEAVENALAAMDFLDVIKPACMIVDETMPGMSGLDLLRQLQARPEWREIPVFFYSAAYDWRKQMEAEALGAKAWFVKGITRLDDLMSDVVAACQT
jgi:two-component system chemotaxis response regulator CheY